MNPAVLVCLFASGAAGLIAEVCWIRRAALAFGSTVDALSTVLAVFLLGLAAGSVLFGERSPRLQRPLRVYVVVELVLAALIVATLPLFGIAEALYGDLYRLTDTPGTAVFAARAALVGLVLIAPTLLMGAALPLICRQVVASRAHLGAAVGRLYAVNTLGGAAGAALCGFVLLPELGMRASLLIAAGLDVLAAAIAAAVGWQWTAPAADETTPTAKPPRRGAGRHADRDAAPAASAAAVVVAVAFFCCGFVALGSEVLWTRFLALVTPSSVLTYTIMLSVVLLGIVAGSLLLASAADRGWPRARLFGALQIANGLAALGIVLLPAAWWRAAGDWWAHALLLLPPAILSGATFPLAVRLVVDDPRLAGVAVGRMTAANTLGGIAGSLLIGFVALPALGLQTSLLLITGIALASGAAVWWLLDSGASRFRRAAAIAAAVALWLAIPRLLGTHIPQDFLAAPHELTGFREGREANLAVVRRQGVLHLEADRWWQGQDQKTHQVLAGHLPLLLHAAPRRVLVVGVGAGQTPASVLTHDEVEQVDAVDIEPAVFGLVREHYPHAWMDDPRLRLIREDGRSFVAHGAAPYDVIALEVGQLFRPGVADFYSADFYRLAKARLAPDGILSQFVPLTFLTPETFRRLVATFLEVFPQSLLFYNSSELLLVGFNGTARIPVARFDLAATNAAIRDDLLYSPWGGPSHWLNQPHVLLGGFLSGPSGLAALAAGAPVERDDRPTLPYATRGARAADLSELAILEILRPHLENPAAVLQGGAEPELLARAAEERQKNLADLTATAQLRRAVTLSADDAERAALVTSARDANPDNVQVHIVLGDIANAQHRAAQAQAHYQDALRIDPQNPAAHLGLARVLQVGGRADSALPHYRAALSERPDDPELHNDIATAYAQLGNREAALRHLQAAVRLSPAFPQAAENLARLQATQP